MRITLATILGLPVCKVGNKFEEIGKFQADVSVTKMEFISYRNLGKNRGGINFKYSDMGKKMGFDGLAGGFVNGEPDLPMLAVLSPRISAKPQANKRR